jgi:hypothetical protein
MTISSRPLLLLTLTLFFLVVPAGSGTAYQTGADSVASDDLFNTGSASFCDVVHVSDTGGVCQGKGFTAELEFPNVDLAHVLSGDEHLPLSEVTLFLPDVVVVNGETRRNVSLILRWEPATPEFLQIHLAEYLPHWDGRVPYRFLWLAQYEACTSADCSDSIHANDRGEYLPSDVSDLRDDLAADINFNGVPAAFWNINVNP